LIDLAQRFIRKTPGNNPRILCAEATVREANASGLNKLRRRGLMRVVIHKRSPGIADEDVQPVAND